MVLLHTNAVCYIYIGKIYNTDRMGRHIMNKVNWEAYLKAEKIKGKLTELKGNTERYLVHNDNSSQHREEMV